MRFYASWYPGDPFYPLYDHDCHVLISPTSVSGTWTLREFPRLPQSVMVDSGGYRYMSTRHQMPTTRDTFERQLGLLDGADVPATLCALDFPMAESGLSANERDRRLTLSLAYAYDLRTLVERHGLAGQIEFMLIVQGHDVATLTHCAREFKSLGFTSFGIGSLAGLQHYDETLARVQAVVSVVGPGVHVFGLSSVRTIRALARIGVASVDSSRPAKSAAYNEVLYSHPFRRYGILDDDGKPTGIIPKRRCLKEPLPCDCPVCREDPWAILRIGKRQHIVNRALHNYFHLKRAIQSDTNE
ncbi:MAG: hypothetical protein KKA73_01580 [Chloroflexi bacterium]|nr:hypothetical protein [Chloroflexota bacterium]MBU1746355.1 hypothetical protein [Chloroflexota bacterium]